ncbi:hypothetical protein QAD02_013863 [Eretmocerus hayati]|uniref:Uncharacterized protein n=1 Tax=Eretmocerus hayati TaxID=131215 RepID=A0ACC2P4W9_9HYME|nr:hypothetical protein QAD02_013863 [Eretmocerus hayati]
MNHVKNAISMGKRLSNNKYKDKELESNRKRIKMLRQREEDYYSIESKVNRENLRTFRQDEIFKNKENDRRKKERYERLDELFSYREKYLQSITNLCKNGKHENYNQAILIKEFLEDRTEDPEHVCSCYFNLFFRKSMYPHFNIQKIQGRAKDKEFQKFLTCLSDDCIQICRYCFKHINKLQIPKTARTLNLEFLVLPEIITSLTDIEERMVSPIIPLMQIRPLLLYSLNPQLCLKGSIVNISVEINDMLRTLPRNFDQLSTIQIQFERHIDHRSMYMDEKIRPSKLIDALDWLIKTPLYKKHSIQVDQKFIDKHKSTTTDVDFIVDPEDLINIPTENKEEKTRTLSRDECLGMEENVIDESNGNREQNEEVLIINRNEEMVNDILVIAPGQNEVPISSRRFENFQELCFPRTYGGHALDEDGLLSYSGRIKYEIRNVDRRSCTTTLLLLMAKLKLEMSVASSINTCLRKTLESDHLKAEDVRDNSKVDDLIRYDDGYRFFKKIRCSPEYWEGVKKRVFATIRQLGFFHLFMTISATENKCPNLLRLLYKLKYYKDISLHDAMHLDMSEKTKLIRDDPVTCVRYIDNRFNEMMKLLEDPNGPYKKYYVKDSFGRNEFQSRGSVHKHAALHCNNGPILIEDDEESHRKVVKFIDEIATCEYDPTNPLMTYQRHRHTRTCRKGKGNKKCRFNIPNSL